MDELAALQQVASRGGNVSPSLFANSEDDLSNDEHGGGYGNAYHDHVGGGGGGGGTRGYGAAQNGYDVSHNGGYGASPALSSWTDQRGRNDDARGLSR